MKAQGLKNSMLQLAVQGKLVEQNPDDEPAAVLLEKIKAEKARLVKEKKIKANKTESSIFKGEDGLFYEDVGGDVRCIDEEIPFEIPESWAWCRLNALCDVTGGYAFKSTDFEKNGMRIIRISDFDENGFKCHRIVRHKYNEKLAPYKLEKCNILMAMTGGTVGKSYFVEEIPEEMVVNQRVATIKINEILCNAYINSVVTAPVTQQIIQAAKNSTNDNISMDDIKSFLIPLPPLSEQQRIVEKIHELQPKIEAYDKAEQDLTILNNRFPDDLKKSVLQYAVQGKLVEQNPDDEPASVLLEKIKAEKARLVKEKKIKADKVDSFIFKGEDGSYYENIGGEIRNIDEEIPFEIPESWVWCRLGKITHNFGQKKPDKDFIYIDVGSIDNKNGKLDKNVTILKPNEAPSRARKIVNRGAVIYSTVRPYLLNICIIDRDFENEPICSTAFAVLNTHVGILNEYLYFMLRSPFFISFVNSQMIGVAYPAINDEALSLGLLPIPPTTEQQRIIEKIKQFLQLCDRLN